jgi:hypothetical protein
MTKIYIIFEKIFNDDTDKPYAIKACINGLAHKVGILSKCEQGWFFTIESELLPTCEVSTYIKLKDCKSAIRQYIKSNLKT